MEHAKYHLVFEAFQDGANKTVVSLTLKNEFKLTDVQIGNLMAGRQTVLKSNLSKDDAKALGQRLTKAGLKVKAQALAVNQKSSPEDLRKHLQEGGLDQYFASRYRHPPDELDTRISLIILVSIPVFCYVILPLISLILLLQVLSFSVWIEQTFAAATQTLIAALLLVPGVLTRPRVRPLSGISLDPSTEDLFYQLSEKLSNHLDAPKISSIHLVDTPELHTKQSFLQWLKGESALVVGLPILESLNLQQFVGLLSVRVAPVSSTFYHRTWGLFLQWYEALHHLNAELARRLDSWIQPLQEHQSDRGFKISQNLIGMTESLFVQRTEKRFHQLFADWDAFLTFRSELRILGFEWASLIQVKQTEKTASNNQEEVLANFRMSSPAIWLLSTSDGYQKMFAKQQPKYFFKMRASDLWQNFQKYQRMKRQFDIKLWPVDMLAPPAEVNTDPAKKKNNPITLFKKGADLRNAQKQLIEHALGVRKKAPEQGKVDKMLASWREYSARYWTEGATQHKIFPVAKQLYATLQTVQQMHYWMIDGDKLSTPANTLKREQINKLYQKLLTQSQKLPALPLLPATGKSLYSQLFVGLTQVQQGSEGLAAATALLKYWQFFLQVYWTFLAGQLLLNTMSSNQSDD